MKCLSNPRLIRILPVLRFEVPRDALVVAILPLLLDPRQYTIDVLRRTTQSRRWFGEALFIGISEGIPLHHSSPVVLDVCRTIEPPSAGISF
jgi:hypothetical protein